MRVEGLMQVRIGKRTTGNDERRAAAQGQMKKYVSPSRVSKLRRRPLSRSEVVCIFAKRRDLGEHNVVDPSGREVGKEVETRSKSLAVAPLRGRSYFTQESAGVVFVKASKHRCKWRTLRFSPCRFPGDITYSRLVNSIQSGPRRLTNGPLNG